VDAPSFYLRYSKPSVQVRGKFDEKVALRDHPKVRDMWPPGPGGAYGRGVTIPIDDSDVLEQVFYYAPVGQAKADVSLKTLHQGHYHTRDLFIDDAGFAQRLALFLRDKVGRRIADLGALEIDF
jgi:hypothetical protein